MYNVKKLMYTRVIMSEFWLVAFEKVIFIDELIGTVKVSFSKILV